MTKSRPSKQNLTPKRYNNVLIRSGEALGIGWSRNILYSGFNILPRSGFWPADFNGRSDNLDVIRLKPKTERMENETRVSALTRTVTRHGISVAEYALLHQLHYEDYSIDSNCFVDYAVRFWCNGMGYPRESNQTYQLAFETLAKRDIIEVIDENRLSEIQAFVSSVPSSPPTHGMPSVGAVAFTDSGRRLWAHLAIARNSYKKQELAFLPGSTVTLHHEFGATIYSVYLCNALKRAIDDGLTVNSVKRLGKWRTWWWRLYSHGFQINCIKSR